MSSTEDWLDKLLDYQQPSDEWTLNSVVGSSEFSGSSAGDWPAVTVVAAAAVAEVVGSFGVEFPCLMMVNLPVEET